MQPLRIIVLFMAAIVLTNAGRLPSSNKLRIRQHCDDCCENDCCCEGQTGWPLAYCLGVSCGEQQFFATLILIGAC